MSFGGPAQVFKNDIPHVNPFQFTFHLRLEGQETLEDVRQRAMRDCPLAKRPALAPAPALLARTGTVDEAVRESLLEGAKCAVCMEVKNFPCPNCNVLLDQEDSALVLATDADGGAVFRKTGKTTDVSLFSGAGKVRLAERQDVRGVGLLN